MSRPPKPGDVLIFKRPGQFPTAQPDRDTRLLKPKHVIRCADCAREVEEITQVNERANARVPVMFKCPKCGTTSHIVCTVEFTAE